MAVQNGLTMAIANPSQDLLVKAAFASDLLLNKTGADIRYINKINSLQKPALRLLSFSRYHEYLLLL